VLQQAAKGAFNAVTAGLGGSGNSLKTVDPGGRPFLAALAAKISEGGEHEL